MVWSGQRQQLAAAGATVATAMLVISGCSSKPGHPANSSATSNSGTVPGPSFRWPLR